jgi:hypothetical protein
VEDPKEANEAVSSSPEATLRQRINSSHVCQEALKTLPRRWAHLSLHDWPFQRGAHPQAPRSQVLLLTNCSAPSKHIQGIGNTVDAAEQEVSALAPRALEPCLPMASPTMEAFTDQTEDVTRKEVPQSSSEQDPSTASEPVSPLLVYSRRTRKNTEQDPLDKAVHVTVPSPTPCTAIVSGKAYPEGDVGRSSEAPAPPEQVSMANQCCERGSPSSDSACGCEFCTTRTGLSGQCCERDSPSTDSACRCEFYSNGYSRRRGSLSNDSARGKNHKYFCFSAPSRGGSGRCSSLGDSVCDRRLLDYSTSFHL